VSKTDPFARLDESEIAAAVRSEAAAGARTNPGPDHLAALFRKAIREILNEDEIKKAIRARLLRELKGEVAARFGPVLMKIGGGSKTGTKGSRKYEGRKAEEFVGWTVAEKIRYSETGERPARLTAPASPKETT